MRKITPALCILPLALCMSACGSTTVTVTTETTAAVAETSASGSLIAQYEDKGYEMKSYSTSDGIFHAVMYSEEKDDYELITITLTDEDKKASDELDFMADDYEEQEAAWLDSLEGGTVSDMSDMAPSEEDMEALVGMTGEELENNDYTKSNWDYDEDNQLYFVYSYYNDDDILIDLAIYFDGAEGMSMEDASDEQINSMTVKQVKFYGFE